MIVDNYDCKPLYDIIINVLNDGKPLGEFQFDVSDSFISITIPDSKITINKFVERWIELRNALCKIGLETSNWVIEHETGNCNLQMIIFDKVL